MQAAAQKTMIPGVDVQTQKDFIDWSRLASMRHGVGWRVQSMCLCVLQEAVG